METAFLISITHQMPTKTDDGYVLCNEEIVYAVHDPDFADEISSQHAFSSAVTRYCKDYPTRTSFSVGLYSRCKRCRLVFRNGVPPFIGEPTKTGDQSLVVYILESDFENVLESLQRNLVDVSDMETYLPTSLVWKSAINVWISKETQETDSLCISPQEKTVITRIVSDEADLPKMKRVKLP